MKWTPKPERVVLKANDFISAVFVIPTPILLIAIPFRFRHLSKFQTASHCDDEHRIAPLTKTLSIAYLYFLQDYLPTCVVTIQNRMLITATRAIISGLGIAVIYVCFVLTMACLNKRHFYHYNDHILSTKRWFLLSELHTNKFHHFDKHANPMI